MSKLSRGTAALIDQWTSSLINATAGDGPSDDPDYSEYWVEAQPFQEAPDPVPEPDPGPDPDMGGNALYRLKNDNNSSSQLRPVEETGREGNSKRNAMAAPKDMTLLGADDWAEDAWTEISPTWAEMLPPVDPSPDDPPADDAGDESGAANAAQIRGERKREMVPENYYESLLDEVKSSRGCLAAAGFSGY